MDQYLSTYRKDFMWPYVKTFPIRTDKQPYQTPQQSRCLCGSEPGGSMPPKEYVGPLEADNYQWSRLGPMAPLLDPKLYPAKMGPAPEFEITRYDQPNTYLKKLQEKYPYLYNVLQSAPPDEMIRRVNVDRLRTTYQADYSHMDEHPSGDYEKLLAQAGIAGCSMGRCSRETPAVLDCRPQLRPPDYDYPIQPGSKRFEHRAISDPGTGFGNDYGRTGHDSRKFGNDYWDTGNEAGGARETPTRGSVFKGYRDTGTRGLNSGVGNGRDGRGGNGSGGRGNFGGGSGVNGGGIGSGRNSVGGGSGGGRSSGGGGGGNGVERVRGGGETGIGGGGSARTSTGGYSTNEGGGGKLKKAGKSVNVKAEASKKSLSAWRSEYQEVIGQTGMDIIRDKMHQHGGPTDGRSFIERIIMKCRK